MNVLDELREVERMMAQGDLAAAQAECKRFLQQHPTHAGAHEMMGDILFARHLWEEAAEWYDLGLQLARSEKLRIKRADANRRAKQARRGPEPTLVDDSETPRRMLWLGLAAAAMLLVIILIGAGIARSGRDEVVRTPPRTAADTPPPARSPGLTGPSAVRGATDRPAPARSPARSPARDVPAPAAQERSEQHWGAQQMERTPPRRPISRTTTTGRTTPEPVIDHDDAVVRAASSLRWDNDQPMSGHVSAMVDPFTGYAVIRVLVPRSVLGDNMREMVVRQAYRVARASFQANEVVTSMTVQMVRDTEDGERTILFRGNTTRRMMQQIETEMPDFDTLWNRVFSTVRWNPLADPGERGVIEDRAAQPGESS